MSKILPPSLFRVGSEIKSIQSADFFNAHGVFIRSSLDVKTIEDARRIAAQISELRRGERITFVLNEKVKRNGGAVQGWHKI